MRVLMRQFPLLEFTMATKCPISRETFQKDAGSTKIVLTIDGKEFPIDPKDVSGDRSEHSLGFGINIRDVVTVGGIKCPAMVQVNVTLIGSKVT